MSDLPTPSNDIEGFTHTKAYLYDGFSSLNGKRVYHCKDIFEYSLPPDIGETIIVSGKTHNLKPKLFIFKVEGIAGIDTLGNLMLNLSQN